MEWTDISGALLVEFAGAAITFCSVIYAIRERWYSWLFVIAGALLYGFIYWNTGLYISAEIQIMYLALGIFGLLRWRKRTESREAAEQIKKGSLAFHFMTISVVLLLTALLAWLNTSLPHIRFVYLDAFLVATAITAQGLTTKKYISSWYGWLIVNIGYLYLFFQQGLWFSLVLYLILFYYTFQGLITWKSRYASYTNNTLPSHE